MELVLRFISFSFVFWYGVKNVDIFYAGQIAQNFELSFYKHDFEIPEVCFLLWKDKLQK